MLDGEVGLLFAYSSIDCKNVGSSVLILLKGILLIDKSEKLVTEIAKLTLVIPPEVLIYILEYDTGVIVKKLDKEASTV